MGLSRITKGVKKMPRRCMLYAVEGIGKSTFASLAPNPIFIPTEEGLNDIDCESFPVASSYKEVFNNISELGAEEHKYKTVIVDTLDWLERFIWAEVTEEVGRKNIEDIGYAKGYKFALPYWLEFLNHLNKLRSEKDMMVLLLAHSKVERFHDPERDSYDKYTPALHKLASAMIREWCDEVLFATYMINIKHEDVGFDKKRAQAKGDGKRIMKTTEQAAHMAKNRLGMPPELEFMWSSYSEYL